MCNIRCIRYITGRIWIRWMYCQHTCTVNVIDHRAVSPLSGSEMHYFQCDVFCVNPSVFAAWVSSSVCVRQILLLLMVIECAVLLLAARGQNPARRDAECGRMLIFCVFVCVIRPLEIFSGVVCAIYILAFCFLVDLEWRLLNTKC